jgi:hypothetical protein
LLQAAFDRRADRHLKPKVAESYRKVPVNGLPLYELSSLSGTSLAQERNLLNRLIEFDLFLIAVQAVGEFVETGKKIRSAIDLVSNATHRPHQSVGAW